MKSTVIPAILALLLIATPSILAVEQQDLLPDCATADFAETGRPVMFPPRNGLSMGISVPHETFQTGDPIVIYVWVNNQTDGEKALGSCSMWGEWGVDVYDSEWHRVETQREKEQESHPALKQHGELFTCPRNVTLRIPPHSCSPLRDMRDVTINLTKGYNLPPGSYFVTEKNLALPRRALSITVVDKKCGRDERSP